MNINYQIKDEHMPLLYSNNKINKCASIRMHSDPKGNERVS